MNQPPPHKVAQWISGLLQEGIILTDALARFLEGTFGSQDIAAVLAQEDGSELSSFIELLCYPDINIQLRYESQWGNQAFNDMDQAQVIENLRAAPCRAGIVSPAGELLCTIDLPAFALAAFVQRLNITWRPPPAMVAVLDNIHPIDAGLKARVHLRNARLSWHEGQIGLMGRFLSKMPAASNDFEPGLKFLISLLSELAPGYDGYEFLVSKKFNYFQSLCRAENFERKRLASNMEILMLQGARAAYGSLEQWRASMRHIDLICHTLFGQTRFFRQPGEQSVDMEGQTPGQTVQEMIRLLS